MERIGATYRYLPSLVMVEITDAVAARPEAIRTLRTIMHRGSKEWVEIQLAATAS